MYIYPPQNIDGERITVTSTATKIYDLINTAQGTTLPKAGFPAGMNALYITVMGDNVNFSVTNEPTTTKGRPLYRGNSYYIPGFDIANAYLISTGSDSECAVQLGKSEFGESSDVSPSGVETSSNNADLISTTATYDSVSMSLADTEYTYTLPSAAKSIEMRLDINSNEDFKLNIGGGVGDSATDYIPVEDGELYWRQNLNLASGTVLRFQSPSASQTMRIVTYS